MYVFVQQFYTYMRHGKGTSPQTNDVDKLE